MDIVISTNSGGEVFLLKELESLGYRGTIIRPTKVKVEGSWWDVGFLNMSLRQAHRVYVLLWEGKIEGLEEAEKVAKELSYKEFYRESFGVRGKRYGKHPFTSVELGKAVGTGIWKALEREGVHPKVDLNNPQMEVHAELSHDHLMILLNTSGESLHKRYKRPFQHHAPLKPSIAATLLYASSFQKKGHLYDPMVGGGTILGEAWMLYTDRRPGLYRNHFLFPTYPAFPPILEELKEELLKVVKGEEPFLIGMDLLRRNIIGAKENLGVLGVKALLHPGDICKRRVKSPLVITNPPYGLRIASKRYIKKVYECFASHVESEEVLALTAEGELMVKALEKAGYKIQLYHRFLYGSLETRLIKAVRE